MKYYHDIIQIYIEGWLIKYHGFSHSDDHIEKYHKQSDIVFQRYGSKLELKQITGNKELTCIDLPQDINAQDCLS